MMAFDRTPTPPGLDPATVEALRAVFARSIARGNHTAELHDVLCNAAHEARNREMPAERLLIVLKDLWYGLPDVSASASPDVQRHLLQELISRCIAEYYSV